MGHFGKMPVRIGLAGAGLAPRWFSTTSDRARSCLDKGGMIPHPLYALVPPSVLPWMLIPCDGGYRHRRRRP